MANGLLRLRLRNYEGEILTGLHTEITLRKNGQPSGNAIPLDFADKIEAIPIPVLQHTRWDGTIDPHRYAIKRIGAFTMGRVRQVFQEHYIPRDVDADWAARFVRWSDVESRFPSLHRLLAASDEVKLTFRDKPPRDLGSFAGQAYDDVDDDDLIEGKAGLLNMHAKLTATNVPGRSDASWFDGIQTLLGIRRDRIVGIASSEMAARAKAINENIRAFPGYKEAQIGQHFESNIKPLIPPNFSSPRFVSLKTRERIGGLQLVVATVTYPGSVVRHFVDADVDENGVPIKHFVDFVKHQFNGGTHPYNIHDILHRTLQNPDLGYRLT